MALLTITTLANSAGPETISLPVDATLSARELVAAGFGQVPAATVRQHEIAITNVMAPGGVSYTLQINQEVASASGFIKRFPPATYIVLASDPATFTYTGSGTVTGTAWLAYNQIPKAGAAGS